MNEVLEQSIRQSLTISLKKLLVAVVKKLFLEKIKMNLKEVQKKLLDIYSGVNPRNVPYIF